VLSFTGSLFVAPPVTDALFRARVPANPLRLARLIVALPVLPRGIDWGKGEAEIPKSGCAAPYMPSMVTWGARIGGVSIWSL
jgi:hypothetical protein